MSLQELRGLVQACVKIDEPFISLIRVELLQQPARLGQPVKQSA
jgi:hypothetical protein